MNNIEKRLARLNGTVEQLYSATVDKRIRERYSVSAEIALLRQRDTKPEEFAEYNAFVEGCKAEVKAELGIGDANV